MRLFSSFALILVITLSQGISADDGDACGKTRCVGGANDGDTCSYAYQCPGGSCDAFNEYETYPNAIQCLVLCDGKTATGNCNGGVGIAPPAGYKRGAVDIEIADDTGCASCTIEYRVGSSSSAQHLRHTLTCGTDTAHNFPEGIGIAGEIYAEVTAQASCTELDFVVHFDRDRE